MDFFSPAFDPVRALATDGLRPPVADVRPLASVLMARGLLPSDHPDYKPTPLRPTPTPSSTPAKPRPPPPDPLAPFTTSPPILPHLSSPSSPSTSPVAGPLSLLHAWLLSSTRVTVVTRSRHAVCSYCHGLVRAFDRHWNLLLADVTEEVRVGGVRGVRERQRRKAAAGEGGRRRWDWVEVDREVWVWQPRFASQMILRGDAVITIRPYTAMLHAQPAAADPG